MNSLKSSFRASRPTLYVFCMCCHEQVNLKKDRVVRHIQSTKHQTRKEKYMQSLQQGKSVTNFLDKLDDGEVTGASGGALQPPKGFEAGLVKRQGFGG